MPRSEKPIDPTRGPLAQFALDLRLLRAEAALTYRQMGAETHFAYSVLSEAASGRQLPSWQVTKAYVAACGGDLDEWQQRWRELAEELRTPSEPAGSAENTSRTPAGAYGHASLLLPESAAAHAVSSVAASPRTPKPIAHGAKDPDPPQHIPDRAVSEPITVFLVDDHEIVRRGIRQLLDGEPDIKVVGEASNAAVAVTLIPSVQPMVAIIDVRLPDGDGITVCRDVRTTAKPPACLMLTSYSDDEALFSAIMAGAAGYMLKQVSGNDIVAAVRTLASGGALLDVKVTETVLNRLRTSLDVDPGYRSLSPQERRVLDLIAAGHTNREIAAELFLAEKTIKNYVSTLMAKLGIERRTEAAVYAMRLRQSHLDFAMNESSPGSASTPTM